MPYMAQSTFWRKGDWGIGKKSTFWEQIGVSADDLNVVSTPVEGGETKYFLHFTWKYTMETQQWTWNMNDLFGQGGTEKYFESQMEIHGEN